MTAPPRRRAAAALGVALLAGCTAARPGGSLEARSLGAEPVVLRGRFVTAYYSDRAGPETALYVSDVPYERLIRGEVERGHVAHLDLLWMPLAGQTPVDSSAANVSIRYIVIADGQVGVYAGAGFAWPRGETGDDALGLSLRGGSLTLVEHSEGFVDLLSPARITGEVMAVRDERRAGRIRHAVSQLVTNALERARLVQRPAPEAGGLRSPRRPLASESFPAP